MVSSWSSNAISDFRTMWSRSNPVVPMPTCHAAESDTSHRFYILFPPLFTLTIRNQVLIPFISDLLHLQSYQWWLESTLYLSIVEIKVKAHKKTREWTAAVGKMWLKNISVRTSLASTLRAPTRAVSLGLDEEGYFRLNVYADDVVVDGSRPQDHSLVSGDGHSGTAIVVL